MIVTQGNTVVNWTIAQGATLAGLNTEAVARETADNQRIEKFSNVATLRSTVGKFEGDLVMTFGYYSAGDGGGNKYYWDEDSVLTDDEGSVISVTGVSVGRWIGDFPGGVVDVKKFGAKPGQNNSPFIQNAVNYLIERGGGTLFYPDGDFNQEEPVYINPTSQIPFTIKGSVSNSCEEFGPAVKKGTTISKTTSGVIFVVNLDEDGNCVMAPDSQYFGFAAEGINFCGTVGVTGIIGIKTFRTRGTYRNLSGKRVDYVVYQPPTDNNAVTNYCDMSTYDNIRIIMSTYSGLRLDTCDGSSIRGFYFENPLSTCKYGFEGINCSGFKIQSIVLGGYNEFQSVISGGALLYFSGGNGISVEAAHIERNKFETCFSFYYCNQIDIKAIHTRYDHNTLYKFDNVDGAFINGHHSWGSPNTSNYDMIVTNSKNIIRGNEKLESYPAHTARNISISSSGPYIGSHGKVVHARIKWTGSGTNFAAFNNAGSVIADFTCTWDSNGLKLNSPYDNLAFVVVSARREVGGVNGYRPLFSNYSTDVQGNSYSKIFFLNDSGTLITTVDNKMDFDIICAIK